MQMGTEGISLNKAEMEGNTYVKTEMEGVLAAFQKSLTTVLIVLHHRIHRAVQTTLQAKLPHTNLYRSRSCRFEELRRKPIPETLPHIGTRTECMW